LELPCGRSRRARPFPRRGVSPPNRPEIVTDISTSTCPAWLCDTAAQVSRQLVSIEVIGPGERSGQRALLSVDRFNKLAAGGDMNTVLMNAVAEQQPQRAAQPRRRGRGTRDGQVTAKRKVEWGLPHRGRISPEKAAWVREHLDEVQQLRSARGMPLLDPADPRTKERYGL
jgi:hypothetical protein